MRNLVIGNGEIGKAIAEVLGDRHEVGVIDIGQEAEGTWDFIHICFPWWSDFEAEVLRYRKKYGHTTTVVVIHSTVPVGTSLRCGSVHSPVRGRHPDLAASVARFTKYFGGAQAYFAARLFEQCGVRCYVTGDSRTTEALKLWDTFIYGWNVLLEKAIWNWCQINEVDFEVAYAHACQTYNDGYSAVGVEWARKYVLRHVPGQIGGHCVVPNASLLNDDVVVPVFEQLRELLEKIA